MALIRKQQMGFVKEMCWGALTAQTSDKWVFYGHLESSGVLFENT